jgi:hypothetical protein
MIERFYAAHIKTLDAAAIDMQKMHLQGTKRPRRRVNPHAPKGPKPPRRRDGSSWIGIKFPVGRTEMDGYKGDVAGVAELVDAPDLNVGRWFGNNPVACCQIR